MKRAVLLSTGFSLLLLIILLDSCGEQPAKEPEFPITAEPAPDSLEIDLTRLASDGKPPAEVIVAIEFDHEFKTAKNYRAFSLRQVLEPAMWQLGIDSTSDEAVVTFYCTDGYKPTAKLRDLLAGEGFVAFRDEAVADPDQQWPEEVRKKFNPFYLVWKNVPYEDDSKPWPYGLFMVKINKANTVYDPIYPQDDAEAIAGFQHFERYCIKCHSINRIGGNVGPDFNDPKNITEYWEIENMWAYAKNPQSFRFNARMAPVTRLTRAEFDQIIVYLQYMRRQKAEAGLGAQ